MVDQMDGMMVLRTTFQWTKFPVFISLISFRSPELGEPYINGPSTPMIKQLIDRCRAAKEGCGWFRITIQHSSLIPLQSKAK